MVIRDQVPFTKPKWLSNKYEPKNDGDFKMISDYPNYNKLKNPLEWIRQLFWCKNKYQKSTLVIDISKDDIDKGEGYIDCFEYIKWYINKNYKKLCNHHYLDRYICFHKH